jgi:hypothetical protein
MLWLIVLVVLTLMLIVSDKIWDNPLTIFGAILLGFSSWLCIAWIVKIVSMT